MMKLMNKPVKGHGDMRGVEMRVKWARYASTANLGLIVLAFLLVGFGYTLPAYGFMLLSTAAFLCLSFTGIYRLALSQSIDEIEREQRNKALALAYRLLGGAAVIIGAILLLTDAPADWFQDKDLRTIFFWLSLYFYVVFPAAILAWRLPIDEVNEA